MVCLCMAWTLELCMYQDQVQGHISILVVQISMLVNIIHCHVTYTGIKVATVEELCKCLYEALRSMGRRLYQNGDLHKAGDLLDTPSIY